MDGEWTRMDGDLKFSIFTVKASQIGDIYLIILGLAVQDHKVPLLVERMGQIVP